MGFYRLSIWGLAQLNLFEFDYIPKAAVGASRAFGGGLNLAADVGVPKVKPMAIKKTKKQKKQKKQETAKKPKSGEAKTPKKSGSGEAKKTPVKERMHRITGLCSTHQSDIDFKSISSSKFLLEIRWVQSYPSLHLFKIQKLLFVTQSLYNMQRQVSLKAWFFEYILLFQNISFHKMWCDSYLLTKKGSRQ